MKTALTRTNATLACLLLSSLGSLSSANAETPVAPDPNQAAVRVNESQVIPKSYRATQVGAEIRPYFIAIETDASPAISNDVEYFPIYGPSICVTAPTYYGPVDPVTFDFNTPGWNSLLPADDQSNWILTIQPVTGNNPDGSQILGGVYSGNYYQWTPGWVNSQALGNRWVYSSGSQNFDLGYPNWYWLQGRGWLYIQESGSIDDLNAGYNSYYAWDPYLNNWLYFSSEGNGDWAYNFDTGAWEGLYHVSLGDYLDLSVADAYALAATDNRIARTSKIDCQGQILTQDFRYYRLNFWTTNGIVTKVTTDAGASAQSYEPLENYIGLTQSEAITLANCEGRAHRIGRIDDQVFVLTEDYNPTRVTFEIDANTVTKVTTDSGESARAYIPLIQYLDLTSAAAFNLAQSDNRPARVVKIDGVDQIVTADYLAERLNFELVADKVVRVTTDSGEVAEMTFSP